ncbi:DNA/RNA helicase domain-containing protein [Vagococcus fluvialis]|uniref:DNA/RNA helicase domain-containing protein n=1 Tax=Vagococcus fluvialis TaxID=2738 RepID=UPI003B5A5AAC
MKSINKDYGVVYSTKHFLASSTDQITRDLNVFVESNGFPVDESQIVSWKDCVEFLQSMMNLSDIFENATLVFEYLLPLEGGRRPDVILLTEEKVIILEFKRKGKILFKDQRQAIEYRQDIGNYHAITSELSMAVSSYLVYTTELDFVENELISILTRDNFFDVITEELKDQKSLEGIDLNEWLMSMYSPLPSIVVASKQLFDTGELPQIKRIKEGDIEDAMTVIREVVDSETLDKTIVFVNGVPGSGKTLVGLKSVYDFLEYGINPIYLSGNGPLVNVLQGLLSDEDNQGRTFIRDMYAFKREYKNLNKVPDNQFIVFDEAQRAWDEEKSKGKSEPETLLSIGDEIAKKHKKITILCLIGDGQAIHTGEEKGMGLWLDAINKHNDWKVVASQQFKGANFDQYVKNKLYLSTSIRHNFINVSPLVESILDGDLEGAKSAYKEINKQGYFIDMVRQFDYLPELAKRLKDRRPSAHIGLFVSSKVTENQLKRVTNGTIDNSYILPKEAYNWYMKDSHKITSVATEFLCQGLESEWPIVCFGGDYYLKDGSWLIDPEVKRKNEYKFDDFGVIVANIYRILLTRSREGMILYIPETDELEELHSFFKEMGVNEI